MITSYIWHCFCTYCTKKYRCLLHFSISMSHSACRAHSVGSKTKSIRPRLRPRPKLQDQDQDQDQNCKTKTKTKTKSIRPRPRPRPVWDQSCHKTAVSDPKTGIFTWKFKTSFSGEGLSPTHGNTPPVRRGHSTFRPFDRLLFSVNCQLCGLIGLCVWKFPVAVCVPETADQSNRTILVTCIGARLQVSVQVSWACVTSIRLTAVRQNAV